MAIKSEVIEQQKPEVKPFPKLMIHESSGKVILATGFNSCGYSGTLIFGKYGAMGEYASTWSLDFIDYNGSITLSNE